jgi:hexosaminidase
MGSFTLNSSTKILYDEQTHKIAEYFADEIAALYGLKIIVKKSPGESGDNIINLQLTKLDHSNSKEAYHLTITKDKILITANEPNGIFYGIQSLRQLLPVEKILMNKNELSVFLLLI